VGLVLDEPRHDAGDRLGFLTATLAFAAQRADLGAPLVAWLREHLEDLAARAAASTVGGDA